MTLAASFVVSGASKECASKQRYPFDAMGFLSVDRESDPAHPGSPTTAGASVLQPGRLPTWRHRDVVGVERVIVDHRLGPVLLPFALGEQIGQSWGLCGAVQPGGTDAFGDQTICDSGPGTGAAGVGVCATSPTETKLKVAMAGR